MKNKVVVLDEDKFEEEVNKAKGVQAMNPSNSMDIEPITPLPQANKGGLWTSKYAPAATNDIIGNASVINSISTWLQNWDRIHIHGGEAAAGKSRGWATANTGAKACLITGPPGIGKTTTIRLLTKEMGYALVEKNSSEQRNKASMNATLMSLKDNQLLTMNEKHLIHRVWNFDNCRKYVY